MNETDGTATSTADAKPDHEAIVWLTEQNLYGTVYLTAGFQIVEKRNSTTTAGVDAEEKVLVHSFEIAPAERALYEIVLKGYVSDYQTTSLNVFDGVKLTYHEPEARELERALPVMKRLNKAIEKHIQATSDYSFASRLIALMKATKATRVKYHSLENRHAVETFYRSEVHAKVTEIAASLVAKYGKVRA